MEEFRKAATKEELDKAINATFIIPKYNIFYVLLFVCEKNVFMLCRKKQVFLILLCCVKKLLLMKKSWLDCYFKTFFATFLQVSTIDFDINFLNFDDPEVLERLTGPDFEKLMKETYGLDFVTKDEGNAKETGKYPEHCIKSESR